MRWERRELPEIKSIGDHCGFACGNPFFFMDMQIIGANSNVLIDVLNERSRKK